MRYVLAAILMLLPGVATAQLHPLHVLSQECRYDRCVQVTSMGTCVAIGRISDREIIATAAHNVEGSLRVSVGIGGQWVVARVDARYTDHDADVALLSVAAGEQPLKCLELADTLPAAGETVTVSGYSQGTSFRSLRGAVQRTRLSGIALTVGVGAHQGQSGGAVTDSSLHLIGIISGTNKASTECYSTPSTTVRAACLRHYGRLPDCGRPPAPRPTVPPRPTTPPTGCGDCTAEFAALRAEIVELRRQLADLQRTPGPAGPPGERGVQGPAGPAGAAGPAGTVTVVIQENGKTLYTLPNLKPGNRVTVPVERYTRGNNGGTNISGTAGGRSAGSDN